MMCQKLGIHLGVKKLCCSGLLLLKKARGISKLTDEKPSPSPAFSFRPAPEKSQALLPFIEGAVTRHNYNHTS